MSESPHRCQHELCSHQHASRVFPCLYHCKRFLCIKHLAEHEQYFDKQIELEQVWNTFLSVFNESQLQQQYEQLKRKLEDHQHMKRDIHHLLLTNNSYHSTANHEQLQKAIDSVQRAMAQATSSPSEIDPVQPKTEMLAHVGATKQQTIDLPPRSSSITTNDESETVDSIPSLWTADESSLETEQQTYDDDDDECEETMDEFDDQASATELTNDGDELEDSITDNKENQLSSHRKICSSKLRGYCPLTENGAFGINSHIHGIRLCPIKAYGNRRTYCLHEHFRRVHHLTSLASLALARAIGAGQDPRSTRVFGDHHIILNVAELRTVYCPMNRAFLHYPTLDVINTPCCATKQVRHLKDHLKRTHKLTSQAARIVVNAVKADAPVHKIQFPHTMHILDDRL